MLWVGAFMLKHNETCIRTLQERDQPQLLIQTNNVENLEALPPTRRVFV
jgi:hypothetical protein